MDASRAESNSRGRALYLLDTENITGMSLPTESALSAARRAIQRVAPVAPGDLVLVGASSSLGAMLSGLEWAGAHLALRRGKDGAERALMDKADPHFVGDRFATLVVGSGDGAFTEYAAAVAGRGVHVVVLARRGALARRLAMVAHEVRFIDGTTAPATAEADPPCRLTDRTIATSNPPRRPSRSLTSRAARERAPVRRRRSTRPGCSTGSPAAGAVCPS